MCFNGNESMFFASERQPSQHKSFFGLLFAAAAQSFFLQTDAKKKTRLRLFPLRVCACRNARELASLPHTACLARGPKPLRR